MSPGCEKCYALTRNARFGGGTAPNWGKGKPRRRTSPGNWKLPLKWNKEAGEIMSDPMVGDMARRPRVFCASLADWLDEDVPIEWLADLMKLVQDTPHLAWLMLTKRPQNWRERLSKAADNLQSRKIDHQQLFEWLVHGTAPANIWLGASVENQKYADERIPLLLDIPAKVRFLSVEPMLGPIDFLRPYCSTCGNSGTAHSMAGAAHCPTCDGGNPFEGGHIHQAIFGGESGAGARPCRVDWIRDGVKQCQNTGVKAFVKQMGSNCVGSEMDKWVCRLKDKKGGDMSEWSEDLRIRDFPSAQ